MADKCKGCGKEITDTKESYIINQNKERFCKACGDNVLKEENQKDPGKVVVIDLDNNEKGLALAK